MPQWSLRTLLIATAAVPLAILAIAKSTPFYVSAVVTIASITWIAVAIMAWTCTGSRQKWARGAILAATAYGLLVVWMGMEVNLYGSKLATSCALLYAHRAVAQPDSEIHVPDEGTVLLGGIKKLVTSDDAEVDEEEEDLGLRAASTSDVSAPQTTTSYGTLVIPPYFPPRLIPPAESFVTIGHIYWAVLAGLVGGWFAEWISSRETKRATKPTFAVE